MPTRAGEFGKRGGPDDQPVPEDPNPGGLAGEPVTYGKQEFQDLLSKLRIRHGKGRSGRLGGFLFSSLFFFFADILGLFFAF